MKAKQIIGAFVGTVFRIVVSVILIMIVYTVALKAYHFGYDVFADMPVTAEASAYTKSVTIMQGDSNMEVAKSLQDAGVIKDANVFYAQLLLSDYRELIKPGIYEIRTSMKSEEIMKVIAPEAADGAEDNESDS